jgi:hypothetical protein
MAWPRVNVLVFPGAGRCWTARGLDHDISADGRTLESAVDALLKITLAHIAYDRRHNRIPLSAFARAPQAYWNAFAGATRVPISMQTVRSDTTPTQITVAVVNQHPGLRNSTMAAQVA